MVNDRDPHFTAQSSGLNFGTPLDLVLSLVVPTIPKLMVRQRDNTEHWNKPLDVCWISSPCLKQNGVTCYIMLSLPSTQQLQRALGALHLSWCYGKQVRPPVDAIMGNKSRVSNAANFA